MLVCSAARMSEEESRSVLLKKYVRKRLRECLRSLLYDPTFACTSDQFLSSWRSELNHTPRMRIGHSLHWNGPGREMPSLQAPNRKPSLFSKLILTPETVSYLASACCTVVMSERQDTNTIMSSAYVETFARKWLGRTRFALLSLSLQIRGSKAKTE